MALLRCFPTDVCGGLYVADDDGSVGDAALVVVAFVRDFEADGTILLDFGGFFVWRIFFSYSTYFTRYPTMTESEHC